MKVWAAVFFGTLGIIGALIFVIWLNVQVYKVFGDTASVISVIVTLAAILATVVTVIKKLFE